MQFEGGAEGATGIRRGLYYRRSFQASQKASTSRTSEMYIADVEQPLMASSYGENYVTFLHNALIFGSLDALSGVGPPSWPERECGFRCRYK